MEGQVPKTTYYRRIRKARELGCAVEELPDNRRFTPSKKTRWRTAGRQRVARDAEGGGGDAK